MLGSYETRNITLTRVFGGPVGFEPTTRGLKGAGTQCVDVRLRLKGLTTSHGGVRKSGAVAVSAAVSPSQEGTRVRRKSVFHSPEGPGCDCFKDSGVRLLTLFHGYPANVDAEET